MIRSAARRTIAAVLLLLALFGCVSCGLVSPLPETTTGESLPPPSAAELRAKIEAPTDESHPSVRAWLSAWGFPAYEESVLGYMEAAYSMYYVGELPDVKTVARELGLLFVEHMDAIDPSDRNDVTDLIMECFLVAVGDRYAYYMNAEALTEYTSDLSGDFVGIGVHVVYREDEETAFCRIVDVFDGSPAAELGILAGDYLVGVDGKRHPEYTYRELIDLVRGEAGSTVVLTLSRDGTEYTVTAERRAVVEETVTGRILPEAPTVGYLRIVEFDRTTLEQFKTTYERLISEGATKLIFDVRDNPGGLLDAILGVLDYLVPEGVTLARYEYYDGETASNASEDDHSIPSDLPIVVLTNGATVSAGELFASALKDFGEMGYLDVTLVGETTFGKGMMQSMINLPGGRATTISIAYYNPPYSDNYEGVGVEPHEPVSLPEAVRDQSLYLLTYEEDTQLQKAVSVLLGQQDREVSLP